MLKDLTTIISWINDSIYTFNIFTSHLRFLCICTCSLTCWVCQTVIQSHTPPTPLTSVSSLRACAFSTDIKFRSLWRFRISIGLVEQRAWQRATGGCEGVAQCSTDGERRRALCHTSCVLYLLNVRVLTSGNSHDLLRRVRRFPEAVLAAVVF